jgi:hypothetical protein
VVPKGGAYLAGRKFDEGVHPPSLPLAPIRLALRIHLHVADIIYGSTDHRRWWGLILGLHIGIKMFLERMWINLFRNGGWLMMSSISVWIGILWLYFPSPPLFTLPCIPGTSLSQFYVPIIISPYPPLSLPLPLYHPPSHLSGFHSFY